ncbi:putative pilus assembly protein FilE [Acinetobacter beijerinckii]|uniref:putative pilus assembly protein FilE n=1 Tax=Acinetobacter TaxID=469 RepID=UPI0020C93226|nr:putative pilus assembly protein FilE [Acinetobacter sp. Z1]UTO18920.1 putative pilus assembly protein FilE [Acinetobacter sp. Z1]
MEKKINQRSKLALLTLCLTYASGSHVYADSFYTIIGPDGRPMIVPRRIENKPLASDNRVAETVKREIPAKQQSQEKQQINKPLVVDSTQSKKQTQPRVENGVEVNNKAHQVESVNKIEPKASPKIEQQKSVKVNVEQPKIISFTPPDLIVQNLDKTEVLPTGNETKPFTNIDGTEYVNNEFLENQEFNLEGKKRFYSLPDGSGRMETIERKKGVSRSVLDKIIGKQPASSTTIALAENYVRLSAEDLAVAFENDRCFLQNYSKSIKTLTSQKEIGLWPRKPLKEKFEYEVVKLDSKVDYIQVDSYASSNQKPSYYWPLIVFLDDKGCMQEGVSGFKNGLLPATLFQHSAIYGVIKIPSNIKYLMMTPLASAVDVSEQELSNQGQIKISVLQ